MSRLTIPVILCALLASAAPARATGPADPAPLLIGADPADCAQANSDYERSELGCPIDEPLGSNAEAPARPPVAPLAAAIISQDD